MSPIARRRERTPAHARLSTDFGAVADPGELCTSLVPARSPHPRMPVRRSLAVTRAWPSASRAEGRATASSTPSAESRARKTPCNALKRFKTGSEIGHAAPSPSSAQPFVQATEGPLAMTDRWAAVLANGKIPITVPPPAGRTLSDKSRARKSPRNTLKRFKTGSEIGGARSGRTAGRGASFRPRPFLRAAEGSLTMTDPWAVALASGTIRVTRAAAGRSDPFSRNSRPENSAQPLEKVQNRLGNRPRSLGANPVTFSRAAEGASR